MSSEDSLQQAEMGERRDVPVRKENEQRPELSR